MSILAHLVRRHRADDGFVRRPPAWREFDPLDIACAAALGVEPQRARHDLLIVEGAIGSVVTASSPCPVAVIETFRGTSVRVFDPLRPTVERLVREGMEHGAALSQANRERIVEAVAARLPIVEIWHDLLHYTDREHFVPIYDHRVRHISGAQEQKRRKAEGRFGARPFQEAYGVYVKRRLAAYADIAMRGDCACSIGVFTEQEFRGQGMGKSAASAATRAILKAGRVPLYTSDETNAASLSICRNLGYLRYGRGLYCFMASEEERTRREEAVLEAERRAADFALHRWVID